MAFLDCKENIFSRPEEAHSSEQKLVSLLKKLFCLKRKPLLHYNKQNEKHPQSKKLLSYSSYFSLNHCRKVNILVLIKYHNKVVFRLVCPSYLNKLDQVSLKELRCGRSLSQKPHPPIVPCIMQPKFCFSENPYQNIRYLPQGASQDDLYDDVASPEGEGSQVMLIFIIYMVLHV